MDELALLRLSLLFSFAVRSKAFHRVRMNLESLNGLREVLGCMQNNVPLHGVSDSEGGIAECRTLYMEFKKMKHSAFKSAEQGDQPPPRTGPDAQAEEEAGALGSHSWICFCAWFRRICSPSFFAGC